MKNKGLQTILYSTVGIAAVALILIGFNLITATFKQRVDLTEEKAYTLSAGTRAILAKLDTPVKIRFYCTQSELSTPETVFLRDYAARVDDLLAEFEVEIVPFDRPMVVHGRRGCASYGKGHNPADLNMGDLFSYALARSLDVPPYFEGLDFFKTDVQDAMAMLGYAFDARHSPRLPPT